jgi:hypothetical protein
MYAYIFIDPFIISISNTSFFAVYLSIVILRNAAKFSKEDCAISYGFAEKPIKSGMQIQTSYQCENSPRGESRKIHLRQIRNDS